MHHKHTHREVATRVARLRPLPLSARQWDRAALSIKPLAETSASQMSSLAQLDTAEGQAYRYALYKLQGGTPFYFRDMATDTRISIGGGYRLDMLRPLTEFSHFVFGSENDDPIFGQGKNDWLYGGPDPFCQNQNYWRAA